MTGTTQSRVAARAERVLAGFAGRGIDALLVSTPAHFAYLSGFMQFDRGAGFLVLAANGRLLLSSALYIEHAKTDAVGWEISEFYHRTFTPVEPLREWLATHSIRRLGFEPDDLTVTQHARFAGIAGDGVELVPSGGLVEPVREVKDEDELARIREAVRITDAAFEHIAGWVRPGVTERQVAWELERHMREGGADGLAFPIIVAAGPHAAVPHHAVTDRPLGEGEPITIDMGARKAGYDADLTRTFCLGEPTARYREVWEAVARANEAVRFGVRAGMTAREGDALARDVLRDAGFGDAFPHGVGHGVGLAIHEAPWVMESSEARLPEGSIMTVEPGVYLPGWGGVRIEDMGVLLADGLEVFTRASKALAIRP